MSTTIQAIERAVDVLFALGHDAIGLSVSEVADRVNLPSSSVHRILTTLCSKSIALQNPRTQRYALHPHILQLNTRFVAQMDIIGIARPSLNQLRDEFQETAVLSLRVGFIVTPIAYSPPPCEHRVAPALGVHYPLHWGACGKVILARFSDSQLASFFRSEQFTLATRETVTDPIALTDELEIIRKRGFAASVNERISGVFEIAASIHSFSNESVGSLGLTGPESRFGRLNQDDAVRNVMAAAHIVSAALDFDS